MTRRTKGPSDVDVWLLAPNGPGHSQLLGRLDRVERARAAELGLHHAARYVRARALLRGVLARRLGCRPRDVELRQRCPYCDRPHGRLEVVGTDATGSPLYVSVTRSGPLVAVAVTSTGPVGIDIEADADVAASPLADVALTPAELDAHLRRPAAARPADLARSWVRKEAVLKASGTGLRTAPALLELADLADLAGPADLRVAHGPDGSPARLSVASLHLGEGISGAVALARPSRGERHRTPSVGVRVHDGGPVLLALTGRAAPPVGVGPAVSGCARGAEPAAGGRPARQPAGLRPA